jgi:hypothetical protein
MVSAAAAMIVWPVARLPVSETRSTRGSELSRGPTFDPDPVTRFATPAGTPASVSVSMSRMDVEGVSSLGLSTKEFPVTRAGATFHAACRRG